MTVHKSSAPMTVQESLEPHGTPMAPRFFREAHGSPAGCSMFGPQSGWPKMATGGPLPLRSAELSTYSTALPAWKAVGKALREE